MAKRLYRSVSNKMIGGVCAGLADYFKIDPVIVRIVAVILLFADGIGFIAYIVAWMIVPVAGPEQESTSPKKESAEHNGKWVRFLPGFLLIAAGTYILAEQYFFWFDIGDLWPLLLIVVGIGVIAMSMKRDGQKAADRMESESQQTNNGESLV